MFLHFQRKNISELTQAAIVFNSKSNFLSYCIYSLELRRYSNAFVIAADRKINIGIKGKIPIAPCLIDDRSDLSLPKKTSCVIGPEKPELDRQACTKWPFPFLRNRYSRPYLISEISISTIWFNTCKRIEANFKIFSKAMRYFKCCIIPPGFFLICEELTSFKCVVIVQLKYCPFMLDGGRGINLYLVICLCKYKILNEQDAAE